MIALVLVACEVVTDRDLETKGRLSETGAVTLWVPDMLSDDEAFDAYRDSVILKVSVAVACFEKLGVGGGVMVAVDESVTVIASVRVRVTFIDLVDDSTSDLVMTFVSVLENVGGGVKVFVIELVTSSVTVDVRDDDIEGKNDSDCCVSEIVSVFEGDGSGALVTDRVDDALSSLENVGEFDADKESASVRVALVNLVDVRIIVAVMRDEEISGVSVSANVCVTVPVKTAVGDMPEIVLVAVEVPTVSVSLAVAETVRDDVNRATLIVSLSDSDSI